MSTLTKIAAAIAERGRYNNWKPGTKKANEWNLEAWCGAIAALEAAGLEHVQSYVAFGIAPRGYSETLKLAEKHTTNAAAAA